MLHEFHQIPHVARDVWSKIASKDVFVKDEEVYLQSQTLPSIIYHIKEGLEISGTDESVLDKLQTTIFENAAKKTSYSSIAGLSSALLDAGLNITSIEENPQLAAKARKIGHVARRLLFSGIGKPFAWCLDKIQEIFEEFLIKRKVNICPNNVKQTPFYVRLPHSMLSCAQFLIGMAGELVKERIAMEMQHVENCLNKATLVLDENDLNTSEGLSVHIQKRDQAWNLFMEAQDAYCSIKKEAHLYVEEKNIFSILNKSGAIRERLQRLEKETIDVEAKKWIDSLGCKEVIESVQAVYRGVGTEADEKRVNESIDLLRGMYKSLINNEKDSYSDFAHYLLDTAEKVMSGKRNSSFNAPDKNFSVHENLYTKFVDNLMKLNELFRNTDASFSLFCEEKSHEVVSFLTTLLDLTWCTPGISDEGEKAVFHLEVRRRYISALSLFEGIVKDFFRRADIFFASKGFIEFFDKKEILLCDLCKEIFAREDVSAFFALLEEFSVVLKGYGIKQQECDLVAQLNRDSSSLKEALRRKTSCSLVGLYQPSEQDKKLLQDIMKIDNELTMHIEGKNYLGIAKILEQQKNQEDVSIGHVGLYRQYMSAKNLLDQKLQQAKILVEEKASQILSSISWDDFENVLLKARSGDAQEAREYLQNLQFAKEFGSTYRKIYVDNLLGEMIRSLQGNFEYIS